MVNPIVQDFLPTQKKEWLRKEIKDKTSEKKKEKLTLEANEIFTVMTLKKAIQGLAQDEFLDNFIFTTKPNKNRPKKNVGLLNFTSYIPKFSNPSIKLNGLIAKSDYKPDGLLRSGNVLKAGLDIYSNSGAGDHTKELIYVYDFLVTYMPDGQMLIEHLQRQDEQAREEAKQVFASLKISGSDFEHIRSKLLLMINQEEAGKTSEAIKQVYFPVANNYHLLSIVSPSALMSELRARITAMQFNDTAKEARKDKKDNKHNENSISDIYNLTKIGFGGANKQNISVLNNKHGGDFYLLPSIPPTLKNRHLQPPKSNFFSESLYFKSFQSDFKKLHQLYTNKDTMLIKKQRRYWIKRIIYQVIEKMWQVRHIEAGWSESDTYNKLKPYQKIWLDHAQKDKRAELDFDLIKVDLSKWIVDSYKKNRDQETTLLGEDHKPYIESIIDEMQEALQ